MVQDSEKRFHQIMDKLFHSPTSTPSSSSSAKGQLSRGQKRSFPSSPLALVEPKTRFDVSDKSRLSSRSAQPSQGPLCRPWDRGDLMKRLSTFKSMTWFAKPQVISAVNCAKRGWVNVEMDIIACEACGARLLFSTPSSWTHQQVEKAASVFSLKLDSGHKLLCPWVDNSCDETLAEFPPTTPQDLVDKFGERSSALFQLSALPVISTSAINHMMSPELEEFLKQPLIPEYGNGGSDCSQLESLSNPYEATSARQYFQAQKLLSLCGWEPRSLSYVVDCKDISSQSAKDSGTFCLSQEGACGKNTSISVYSADTHRTSDVNESFGSHNGVQSDTNSVVLDCKLCGASAGLWVFSTVPRPLEMFRVVGDIEVNNAEKSGDGAGVGDTISGRQAQPLKLNLTIAGGPLATQQNFKATVSFPLVGRNLRDRLAYDSDFTDRTYSTPEQSKLKDRLISNGGQVAQSEDLYLLENGNDDRMHDTSAAEHQIPCLETETARDGDIHVEDYNSQTPLALKDVAEQGPLDSEKKEYTVDNPTDIRHSAEQGFIDGDKFLGIAEISGLVNPATKDLGSLQDGDASKSSQDIVGTDIVCVDASIIHSREGGAAVQENITTWSTNQEGVMVRFETRGNNGKGSNADKNLAESPLEKATEFDLLRQHRHFCPWTASTGCRVPGWRQTLFALQREKNSSPSSTIKSPSSASSIQVDDPITCIRNLFMTPSAKRHKPSPSWGSS